MIEIYKGFWTLQTALNNPTKLYLFGDNDVGKGCGGQAIIRTAPNSCGIPTKKLPSLAPNSFYTDQEYDLNVKKIDVAINKIKLLSKDYEAVVFPADGFGTGLAKLEEHAPLTFIYLINAVDDLKMWLVS